MDTSVFLSVPKYSVSKRANSLPSPSSHSVDQMAKGDCRKHLFPSTLKPRVSTSKTGSQILLSRRTSAERFYSGKPTKVLSVGSIASSSTPPPRRFAFAMPPNWDNEWHMNCKQFAWFLQCVNLKHFRRDGNGSKGYILPGGLELRGI